jgi:oligosaccharide reducing-end xylanase
MKSPRSSPLAPLALCLVQCVSSSTPKGGSEAPTATTTPAATLEVPAQGAFTSGKYRNVFTELGYSESAVQEKVNTAYAQLFHGELSQQTVMFDAGSNEHGKLAYIKDIGNGDVRSEGMSTA